MCGSNYQKVPVQDLQPGDSVETNAGTTKVHRVAFNPGVAGWVATAGTRPISRRCAAAWITSAVRRSAERRDKYE